MSRQYESRLQDWGLLRMSFAVQPEPLSSTKVWPVLVDVFAIMNQSSALMIPFLMEQHRGHYVDHSKAHSIYAAVGISSI
jgi:hypothetical protein